jgi:hypothetical protein
MASQGQSVSEEVVTVAGGPAIVITHVKQHNASSASPPTDLHESFLAELELELKPGCQARSTGKFISVRTIAAPGEAKNCAFHVAVQDGRGDTALLRCFFHYDLEGEGGGGGGRELRDSLPISCKMKVKEPWCENVDGRIVLTLEHPCDLAVDWPEDGPALPCEQPALERTSLGEWPHEEKPEMLYDFGSMMRRVDEGQISLEETSFAGSITLQDFGSRGYGYKASAHIRPGQLLLCEKAFASAHQTMEDQTYPLILDHLSQTVLAGSQARLSSIVARKLSSSAEARHVFSHLYSQGATRGKVVQLLDGQAAIDSYVGFLISLRHLLQPLLFC